MGALRQSGLALFAVLLFEAAVALGIIAGLSYGAGGVKPPAPPVRLRDYRVVLIGML